MKRDRRCQKYRDISSPYPSHVRFRPGSLWVEVRLIERFLSVGYNWLLNKELYSISIDYSLIRGVVILLQ